MSSHSLASRRRSRSAMTMVETAVVVSLVGVVCAVFIPTFGRHLQVSKISEASQQLQKLHSLTWAYYRSSWRVASGSLARNCLPVGAGPTPSEVPKKTSVPGNESFAKPKNATPTAWNALGFTPEEPLRYRYTFLPTRSGCFISAHDLFVTLRAEGDIDGDGTISTFERYVSPIHWKNQFLEVMNRVE